MPRSFRASSDSSQSQLELPLWAFSTMLVSRSSFSCRDCHSSWGIRSMKSGGVLLEYELLNDLGIFFKEFENT